MILRDNAPGYEFAWVTYAACGLWLVSLILGAAMPGGYEAQLALFGASPERLFGGAVLPGGLPGWLSLFTAAFVNVHFVSGVLALLLLWQFGDNVEYVVGRARYVLFFLGCSMAGTLACVGMAPSADYLVGGTPGAAGGAALAYLLCFPRARVTFLTYIEPYTTDHVLAGDWGYQIRNMSVFWYTGGILGGCLLWAGLLLALGGDVDAWCMQFNVGAVAGGLCGALLLYLLELPGRRPGREHPTVDDPLSAPIVGDEGDYGEGDVRGAPTLGAEMARLSRSKAGREHRAALARLDAFSDRFADQLIEQGALADAEQHCTDMLDLARRAGDARLTRGYRRLLGEIEQRQAQARTAALAARREAGSTPDAEEERLEAAIAASRAGVSASADTHGLGNVERGRRRR